MEEGVLGEFWGDLGRSMVSLELFHVVFISGKLVLVKIGPAWLGTLETWGNNE